MRDALECLQKMLLYVKLPTQKAGNVVYIQQSRGLTKTNSPNVDSKGEIRSRLIKLIILELVPERLIHYLWQTTGEFFADSFSMRISESCHFLRIIVRKKIFFQLLGTSSTKKMCLNTEFTQHDNIECVFVTKISLSNSSREERNFFSSFKL